MLKTPVRLLLIVIVLALAGTPAAGRARPGPEGYLRPVVAEGYVFPVARSTWYSVINFRNDWHAPRMRLIDGVWRQVGVHEGNDIFAEPGTPVRAAIGGTVEQVGWTFYSGWRVGVRSADNKYWFYAHLRALPRVTPGESVQPGDRLGRVGNTGYGYVPGHHNEFTYHLHLGIQEPDGTWINPYPLVRRLYRRSVAH